MPKHQHDWSYDQANKYLGIEFLGGVGFPVHRYSFLQLVTNTRLYDLLLQEMASYLYKE